jgi:phosphoribosyl-AMP cyclohydrolase
VSEIRLDCDGDVILLMIEQVGGIACHTGRESCMYRRLEPQGQGATQAVGRWVWHAVDPVLKDPEEIYSSKKP